MSKHSCLQNEYTCMKISDTATMIGSYMCNRKANHVGTSIRSSCGNSDEYKEKHIRLKVLINTLYRSRRCACLTTQGDHSRTKAIILKRSLSEIRTNELNPHGSFVLCLSHSHNCQQQTGRIRLSFHKVSDVQGSGSQIPAFVSQH